MYIPPFIQRSLVWMLATILCRVIFLYRISCSLTNTHKMFGVLLLLLSSSFLDNWYIIILHVELKRKRSKGWLSHRCIFWFYIYTSIFKDQQLFMLLQVLHHQHLSQTKESEMCCLVKKYLQLQTYLPRNHHHGCSTIGARLVSGDIAVLRFSKWLCNRRQLSDIPFPSAIAQEYLAFLI